MKASAFAHIIKGQLIGQDVDFEQFSTDSRSLKPGDLFIALKGETFDGHHYLAQALEKGAALALVDHAQSIDIPQIVVDNTELALGRWAAYHRAALPELRVIAVTGSCGKTTTKQMMSGIFSECGPTHAAQGSFNNHFGVPMTLLGLTEQHRFAVIEMGANHMHEILPLSQMAKPDVAIITNVAPVHTEGFGGLDGIAETKGEIFQGLPHKGCAILNTEDAYYPYWLTGLKDKQVLGFAMEQNGKADVFASDIHLKDGCAGFLLHTPKGNIQVQLPILGRHNVVNALAAASAAIALDVPLSAIQSGLAKMTPAKHRLHVCKGVNHALLIDDAYNANPLAVKAALDILATYPGEKVWVFFDMKELGHLAQSEHEEVGRVAKQKGINKIFALGSLTPFTVETFGPGAQHFPDKASLIAALKPLMHDKMTILIKGSRSGALEEVVQALSLIH